jgi:very-short-patch-repair endonuclease
VGVVTLGSMVEIEMPWKQMPEKATEPKAKVNARKLRRAMTDAEKQLWTHLRHGFASEGMHFRKQVAIGQYVADFCCLRHRLIVELDGPIHRTVAAKSYDRGREQVLKAAGYRVLRFSNEDIVLGFKSVLDRIASALGGTTPTPSPSPQGGGESW